MTSNALKKAAIQQRMLFRQSIYYIWGMGKPNRRDETSEIEKIIEKDLSSNTTCH